jgi:hypothetical protein
VKRIVFLLVTLGLLAGPALLGCGGVEEKITFPDSNLEAAIRVAIMKAKGSIYISDLDSITTLKAPQRGIRDLTGLEYCVNLRTLELGHNNISDVSPLSALTNLGELWLFDNNISDISALADLANLETLDLWNNNINDISALVSLTNLWYLNLSTNNISDILPLVQNNGLSAGDTVNITANSLDIIALDLFIPWLESRGIILEWWSTQTLH